LSSGEKKKAEGRQPSAALSIHLRWREEEVYFFTRPRRTAPMLISSIEDEDGRAGTAEHGAAKTAPFSSPKKIHPPNFFISSLTVLKEFYFTQSQL
jgi:hypothetical protein